jgi:predicted nucleic acid-binding protein
VSDYAYINASPIIFLSQAGLLDMLRLVATEIRLTASVEQEIRKKPASDLAVKAVSDMRWFIRVTDPIIPPVVADWGLGPGESSVLAACLCNPEGPAILDDLAARRCANTLGIPLTGTLGLVLKAKQGGHIPAAEPVIRSLKVHGMYLSEKTIIRALAMVGEV